MNSLLCIYVGLCKELKVLFFNIFFILESIYSTLLLYLRETSNGLYMVRTCLFVPSSYLSSSGKINRGSFLPDAILNPLWAGLKTLLIDFQSIF